MLINSSHATYRKSHYKLLNAGLVKITNYNLQVRTIQERASIASYSAYPNIHSPTAPLALLHWLFSQ